MFTPLNQTFLFSGAESHVIRRRSSLATSECFLATGSQVGRSDDALSSITSISSSSSFCLFVLYMRSLRSSAQAAAAAVRNTGGHGGFCNSVQERATLRRRAVGQHGRVHPFTKLAPLKINEYTLFRLSVSISLNMGLSGNIIFNQEIHLDMCKFYVYGRMFAICTYRNVSLI